ncbi:MAG: poly(beta-D-mannuronate) lyase [Rikenellaceae bacterium]|jgi:poly(beta-D-mannuronate) lyase|nr:poly(beta-D-mannuronate) lyase [Rikenellaceae bacterium]
MVKRIFFILAFALAACSCVRGPVSPDRLQKAIASAMPGDTIFVRDGIYSDCELSLRTDGPVVVSAQSPGGVVFTGKSVLRISGNGLEVRDFLFRECFAGKGAVVEFRDGDSLAHGCRLTSCVIQDCNPQHRDIPFSYVSIYGRNNRVDHCSFMGKLSLGVTLLVMLDHEGCDNNHHSIDHNIFGPRPVYGSNGSETIRVGTSIQCMQNSRTLIADNLFDRCNGEVEVVSIKSCENTIARNVFYECQGVLALRHGDRNIAEENMFLGHGVRNTGGIRIVGEDQIVRRNLFYSLAGERFFSALALMYGVPNSLPNRYMQVKNTIIQDNVFEDCKSIDFSTGKDFERTLPPIGTIWTGNTVSAKRSSAVPAFSELLVNRGADWYVGEEQKEPIIAKMCNLSPEDNLPALTDEAASGTVFILEDGIYPLERAMEIKVPMEIRAAEGASPKMLFRGRKTDNMITISDGGSLIVRGIAFSGEATPGKALAKSMISTAADMLQPYTLIVENCSFSDCGQGGFIPIRGLKGTFADTVAIRECRFSSLSGDAVNYADETEDKGRYNADDMFIENCHFERILGIPINIYRGGSDESTAGPYVHINNCSFYDCCNKVRGSVIRITGAQILDIRNCNFVSSGRGGYSVRLDDAPWEKLDISGNSFKDSGKILWNR